MADYYGVNATKALDPTSANITAGGLLGGRVKCMIDTYEAAAVAAGSTIAMGKALPVGAVILGIDVSCDDLSDAGATIDIGDASDDDRYMSAVDVATAGHYDAILPDGMGYTIGTATDADDTQILVLVNTAAITGTLKVCVYYTTD